MTNDEARAVLGVRQNASRKSIDKAYRRKAMTHHPDRGGDHDKFVEAQQAYDQLTGRAEARAQQTDPALLAALAVLGECLGAVLMQMFNEGRSPATNDVLRLMAAGLDSGLKVHRDNLTAIDKATAHLEKARGRFARVQGEGAAQDEDVLSGMLEAHIAKMRAERTAMTAKITNVERAKKLLTDYRYRTDGASPMDFEIGKLLASVKSIRWSSV